MKLSKTTADKSFQYSWLLKQIWPYIKPYSFRIILGFLVAIPLGLLEGVTAIALKPYMDYVVGGKLLEFTVFGHQVSLNSNQMAWLIPIAVVLFAALQGVLRYLSGYISTWSSQKITNDIKFELFERLVYMHPKFFDENESGIIYSRYLYDPQIASNGIVDQIKTITTSLFGAIGLVAVMLYSSWRLAIIGVIVLVVAFVPAALIRKRIKKASNRNMVISGNLTTNIYETYSGNKVMAAYGLQERQNKYFREQTIEAFKVNISLYKRSGWMSPLMYMIASLGIATVLGYGTFLIRNDIMTAGAFASFVTSLLLLYKPVKTLGNTLTNVQNLFVAMSRVFELFELTPEIKDAEKPLELSEVRDGVSFENVTFEYEENTPVLKNLNLRVPKNETLAIVGNSGGGKSTLVNLLPRFYDVKEGAVKIDGKDIREISLSSLRKNISMVFQDNFLYTGTIRENIMMGNYQASEAELNQAVKAAHLEDFLSELPDGLDTWLGERGTTLSGGQRQRVAIARALLRNAPIVILDEATSALDNESEAIVQKAMDNLMQNRTVFIIAHRLSTIKNANRIAVINNGELVELGSHDELMNIPDGQYKALYDMQFKNQE
ncbi:MAG: ABC transporter ATP-binding protein [Lentisphaeria bacterium]|nr:ABC transporter ATP-binding protein [Lentisphaeria bacterium]